MTADAPAALSIPRAQLRVLTLRFNERDLAALNHRHLVYGLLLTWAVGLGRYWDHPNPYALQALGLGSLVVMAALGLFLYTILWPLRPARWSLVHLYTFLSLTAAPGLLYAIPVEKLLDRSAAGRANLYFLGIVALWRVAMLGRYLARWTDLSAGVALAALLLPLALIVVALGALNLDHAVFELMASVRDGSGTVHDQAYAFLVLLSVLAYTTSPLLLLAYGIAVWQRWRTRPASQRA